ncbi:HEAT repeat domain-containing protein [Anatilimnocola floriformis]|uniref:HEAT repeat domain-containing protein n=1 Tax=Anatilimnocola floriformis TaxID=2948575 RepID=UPI0020C3380F|nr:hypothetical protein [Anatilimnocola floriformis]
MSEFFSSPLQRAISRGMQPGKNLVEELGELSDYTVSSAKDGEAIVAALQQLPLGREEKTYTTSLRLLTGLFQDVDGRESPAYEVLFESGLPELVRIFRAQFPTTDDKLADDLLFVLKILAMYGAPEGPECVLQAVRLPLKPGDYMWQMVLGGYSPEHPQRDEIFAALRDPLPPDFIGMSLLDAANGAAIEGDLAEHPFDTPAGHAQLRAWLEDTNPEHFSYAHSATAALPFLDPEARDPLLDIALDHVDTGVQLEGAWAAAKVGRDEGLDFLARYCLDVNHGDVAARYLKELDREDRIPEAATNPDFQAKTTFARWLSHPNELGRAPDEIEIIDKRELVWPPEHEPTDFWLVRFLARDPEGLEADRIDCGLVGSMTWSFLTYQMHLRPPEDAYAIHCYFEMQNLNLIEEAEVDDPSDYAHQVAQWQGPPLVDLKLQEVAEISPELQITPRLVVLGTATVEGVPGWIVLDGPRSQFYPAAEQPSDASRIPPTLMMHVGRQILGFPLTADRLTYLNQSKPQVDPELFLGSYERLLKEVADRRTPPERQKELLVSWSPLTRHFDKYVELLSAANGIPLVQTRIEAYHRVLAIATEADESIRRDVLDELGLVGSKFNDLVTDLQATDNQQAAEALLDLFAPLWDSNLGYGQLSSAAFRLGRVDVAEKFALKLLNDYEQYFRSEEMSRLAELWHSRGETDRARELLLDCLRKTAVHIQESKYNSDRDMFAAEYAVHRATYLKLFDNDEEGLLAQGIVVDPLQLPRIQRTE